MSDLVKQDKYYLQKKHHNIELNVIFSCTRQQAICNGLLIDVTDTAKKIGFKLPVAITDNVWQGCIYWDNWDNTIYQDICCRLYDVLWVALLATYKNKSSDTVYFNILETPQREDKTSEITLKALCYPGDNVEPVITIFRPWEN